MLISKRFQQRTRNGGLVDGVITSSERRAFFILSIKPLWIWRTKWRNPTRKMATRILGTPQVVFIPSKRYP